MARLYRLNPNHPDVKKTGTAAVGKNYYKVDQDIVGDNFDALANPTNSAPIPLLLRAGGKPSPPTPLHHPTESREQYLARAELAQRAQMEDRQGTQMPTRMAEWDEPPPKMAAPLNPGAPESVRATEAEVLSALAGTGLNPKPGTQPAGSLKETVTQDPFVPNVESQASGQSMHEAVEMMAAAAGAQGSGGGAANGGQSSEDDDEPVPVVQQRVAQSSGSRRRGR